LSPSIVRARAPPEQRAEADREPEDRGGDGRVDELRRLDALRGERDDVVVRSVQHAQPGREVRLELGEVLEHHPVEQHAPTRATDLHERRVAEVAVRVRALDVDADDGEVEVGEGGAHA
jgi:hypothetical protein